MHIDIGVDWLITYVEWDKREREKMQNEYFIWIFNCASYKEITTHEQTNMT